jgi:hypothetical protein
MTKNVTLFVQIVAIILQVLNAVNVAQLPTGWQATFAGILTIAQAVQALIAHYYTPTGESISVGSSIVTAAGTRTIAR